MSKPGKPKPHPASLPIETLLQNCETKKTRRGGPGGQHRNKVETAIVITHRPTGIIGQASERRSQQKNREVAIERLRLNLAIGIRSERTEATEDGLSDQPSPLWQSRVRGQKISVNPGHGDFPALLAEALDCIQVCEFDIPKAAKWLKVSSSQLIKFVKLAPAAFEALNRNRNEHGLGVLK